MNNNIIQDQGHTLQQAASLQQTAPPSYALEDQRSSLLNASGALPGSFAPFLSEGIIGCLVSDLADQIYCNYPNGLVVCPVLSGASIFAADLVRRINLEILNLTHLRPISVELNFIKYSSYQGTESTNVLVAELPFNPAKIRNKDIVIVEDIVDTGFTTDRLRKIALKLGARSVKVCTLLFRPRAFKGQQKPEYIGYNLPDDTGFVIGYGMDLDERYRELPEIWAEPLTV